VVVRLQYLILYTKICVKVVTPLLYIHHRQYFLLLFYIKSSVCGWRFKERLVFPILVAINLKWEYNIDAEMTFIQIFFIHIGMYIFSKRSIILVAP